jgi:triacylglycerol esterase/lipase EstA (alpha/beta hydrolase family)
MHRIAIVVALTLTTLLATAPLAPADARPGPALDVPEATLAQALVCPTLFSHPEHPVVLLVHGTATTPEASWSWNYERSLPAAGWDTCTVRLPDRAMGDIQTAAEYVVWAVRRLHELTDHKVSIIGHSQGTLEPRWALKWWPDVRADVDDLILLAGPGHGVWSADGVCATGPCFPAAQQMRTTSRFIAALNRGGEVPRGVSVTSIYSLTDELVEPAAFPAPTAALRGASNVALQSICPARPVHHVGLLFDPTAYALALDALRHPGPADPHHVSPAVCGQLTAPHVDVVRGAVLADGYLYADAGSTVAEYPPVPSEPALRAYVR